ncbi:glycosyltransferase family 2 protein [Chitinophagaceae bacterium MMS25-I14]
MESYNRPLPPVVAIIAPCYNEEDVLPISSVKMKEILQDLIEAKVIDSSSYLVFVDDGSKDKTWDIIQSLNKADSRYFKGLKLSKNRGHQNAVLAGLLTYAEEADVLITIDVDLQDDPSVIKDMIALYGSGYEVVYGVRKSRVKDSFFKKATAEFFYKIMKKLGVNIVFNHADYRMATKRVILELDKFKETNLFLRGLFPFIGFKSAEVYYDREERQAGESKYPLRKMISFAWDGISSFSSKPLRFIFYLGMLAFIITMLLTIFTLISYFEGKVVKGWSSIVISIYFLGSIQLISLGIIGEYIGKIFNEVKRRPNFIIENKI